MNDAAPMEEDKEIAAYRTMAAEAVQGDLVFPTSAELGLRIKRLLDDPDCALDQVAKLVQAEPLLAAKVVALANSVAYNRSGREIADVRQAVPRLGFRTLRSLTMSVLVRQISGAVSEPKRQALARQLWEHTVHVAALAHVLARRVTHQDAESALFAGMLHEVAGFYLIAHAAPELLETAPAGWQGEGESLVGTALLKLLDVPETVGSAIAALWDGYLELPPASLGDTLLLAEQLAPVASPLYWRPEASAGADAGTPQIEMVVDRETLTSIMEESAAEVRSLIEALR